MINVDWTGWILTYTGRKFNVFNPKIEDISIIDIAHALSLKCRFSGHCSSFYSVAQHSTIISQNMKEYPLWGLFHDAPEAYTGDISRPIKKKLLDLGITIFRDIENQIMELICEKYNLPKEAPKEVKELDEKLLSTEYRDLMKTHPEWYICEANGFIPYEDNIRPFFTADVAEYFFLQEFNKLTKGKTCS